MPLRIGPFVGIAAGMLAGLGAGVAVSAGAAGAPTAPAATDAVEYEIVRVSFAGSEDTAEGTARCSEGRFVFGGGGRVLGEGIPRYTLVASDPTGPSGWTAAFVRTAEPPPGLVPGPPGQEQDEEEQPETHFEVSAVCAAPGR